MDHLQKKLSNSIVINIKTTLNSNSNNLFVNILTNYYIMCDCECVPCLEHNCSACILRTLFLL